MKEKKFAAELDYLISDMNAYAVHLLKCLKAALFHYHSDGTIFFNQWLEKIKVDENQKKAFLLLNTADYVDTNQDAFLLEMLGNWKRQTP
jgi:hypothetical protein